MQHANKLAFWVAALAALGACSSSKSGNGNGDGGSNGGDGGSNQQLMDAAITCNYTEATDVSNATTPEATGVTIGAQTQELCGQVDSGHLLAGSNVIDVDEYGVTVAGATAELLVQFEDDTPANLTDFQVLITDTMTNATLLNAGDYTGALGDHGAFLAELPAGTYNIVVTATGTTAISNAIPYKIRFVADQPTTRCADLTGMAADYTEADDGASNNGNDVVDVDFTKTPSFTATAATTDAPETTGLTIDPKVTKHIAGSSAAVAAGTDKYLDRDTFAITTGANTNELSIRLNWPGATADLDYIVFPATSIMVPNQVSTLTATTEDEFATFAVQPNTGYWVWIGAYAGSTGTPIAYSASVCGGQFIP